MINPPLITILQNQHRRLREPSSKPAERAFGQGGGLVTYRDGSPGHPQFQIAD